MGVQLCVIEGGFAIGIGSAEIGTGIEQGFDDFQKTFFTGNDEGGTSPLIARIGIFSHLYKLPHSEGAPACNRIKERRLALMIPDIPPGT